MNEPNRFAVVATTVFDGDECHRDAAVVVEGSKILGVVHGMSCRHPSLRKYCRLGFGSPRASSIAR